jgi:PAS domain S-box-containing protein
MRKKSPAKSAKTKRTSAHGSKTAKSTARYELFFNASADLLCIVGNDGFFKNVNPAFEAILGYAEEEIYLTPIVELIHPDDVAPSLAARKKVLRKAISIFENRLRCKNGSYKWFSWKSTPVGKLAYAVGRDITKQKNREAALQKSRDHLEEKFLERTQEFSVLAESLPHLLWVIGADGKAIYFNQRWIDLTGSSLEKTQAWEDIIHADDVPLARAAWEQSLQTGDAYNVEYRLKGPDGAYRWYLTRAIPLKRPDGKILKWFGTCTDIEDQKRVDEERVRLLSEEQASAEIKRSREFLNAVIENLPSMVFVKDAKDLRYIKINKAGEETLGLSSAELLGKNAYDIYPKTQADAQTARAYQVLAQNEVLDIPEETVHLRNGISRILHTKELPLLAPDGQARYILGISEDITEMKWVERKLLEANEQALAAVRAKSQFLANISHEIRTPLNGVMGMTSILLDTRLTDEQRDYAEIIRKSADTLLVIVNDVLDLAKSESGKMDLEEIDFELDQVVLDIERTLSLSAKKKGLRLQSSFDQNLPKFVKGDPTRLRQILLNLVSNSIKFTKTGSVDIRVSSIVTDEKLCQVRFEVKDTGVGISADAMARIFSPFSQADSSTTRRYGGTGLGLSICKHLVELMRGEIAATSEEGRGSVFRFDLSLPMGCAPVQVEVLSKINDLSPKASGYLRILLAEDNSVNQMIVIKMLEKMGHAAVAVGNGKEALEALRLAPYDLVLMDCQMPVLDGYETTRLIRQFENPILRDIAVVAITANAMLGDRENCLKAGMNDYISKPIKAKDLELVINRMMGLRKLSA